MFSYLLLGLSMGLSAGFSPGPLMTLVVTASLRSGLRGGLRVAMAPLLTDLPIILLSVLLLGRLPPHVLRWVGLVGGLVLIWLGVEGIRAARKAQLPTDDGRASDPSRDLWRGAAVNALNPNPYLFWGTVGGPVLVSGWRLSPWHVLAFLVPFYTLLVGLLMSMAWLVSHQAGRLSLVWYRRVLTGCGLLMLGLGGLLIWKTWAGL